MDIFDFGQKFCSYIYVVGWRMMFGPIIRQICPPRPPKKIKIVAAVRGRVANGRACPSLWFAWVEFCYLLLPLMLVLPLSHYNVVFGWLAEDVIVSFWISSWVSVLIPIVELVVLLVDRLSSHC